ncbi:FAD-dependent oxidoreductase [Streptococcus moroccensis]|uniref:Urocanate reductase n=1 Tax=Streptococcus moroccensis TaxID=1451356 RepID=A0ABT9YQR8_9STRE|nr:FAD-dependent oxidoreductase [Streptococcus moroccensis]MDQ0222340.1 fumarate reductase flavoprotein subunit [Streptococcus moroccensis]
MTTLKNGTFIGTGEGQHGNYDVEVQILDGKLLSVKVLGDHGSPAYPDNAASLIPGRIVAAQSTEVDAVSGATVSSHAIMDAVKDAMKKAGLQEEQDLSDREILVDVAIVAAGPAGLAAAVTAAEAGLSVVVFEKQSITGGTANMGMGPLGINTKIQKAMFNDLSVKDALTKQMEYTHYRVDSGLVQTYFNLSADTIEWLEEMGVKFAGAFRYFKESEATWHIVDNEGKIGPGAAAPMNKAMTERAKSLGVTFYLNTPVEELLVENNEVVGLRAQTKEGQVIIARAKAVVVATGGFGSNPQMIQDEFGYELNKDFYTFNVPGITGEGLKMMWEAGAQKFGLATEAIFVLPHNLQYMIADGVLRQPNLLINQHGERFMNEGFMGNTTFAGNAIDLQPGHYAYCIMDRAILKEYQENGPDIVDFVHPVQGFHIIDQDIQKAKENNYEGIITADTLDELADKLSIPVQKLSETIEQYNHYCETGVDELFYKDVKYLHPLTGEGGYLVGKYYVGAYGTMGGVRINSSCQVLDKDGKWIQGLYSAGSDANTIYGDSYNFTLPGNSMGFAVNSGRMAGKAIIDSFKG